MLLWNISPLKADTLSVQNLYTNPTAQTLPEALILHNSENPCENCLPAINMIIAVLKANYKHKLHAYLIDTAKHPEFADTFQAHAPLTLVIVRISDGASFGYKKLIGLQSQTDDKEYFSRRITEFIDNFLGWD